VSIVQEQFSQLQENAGASSGFARAELIQIPNGTYLVKLYDFRLPKGWNQQTVNVYFLLPVGYPVARPDTFWTDPGLTLLNGGPPANTGTNQPEGVPPGLLWFSWHPSAWNPNRDTLSTYVAIIRQRFNEIR